ncbi:MAG TPA: YidC/Oxa1 family membrane protein insertase, partial [Nitrospiraceae bacterium]|nr:YidC/Oxa1 family membrane protein insertase [Nitrospiraceae bacterium]
MNVLYQVLIAPIEWVMLTALSAVFAVTGSYGISIFLLSLLINAALLPLFQLAERWQEAERRIQKELAPKLAQFKQAFSGEERHVMIHTLYRQAGYHPIYAMRSSIGLFLQLPFWIAAYQMLSHYQPLDGASFLIFDDLGRPDRLLGGINLLPFMMTALNLAAAFLYTTKLSRAEQIQPVVLALIFLALLYVAPAGLLLYWTFNSLFSLVRIAFLNPAQAPAHGRADFVPSSSIEAQQGSASGSWDRSAILTLASLGFVAAAQSAVHLDRFAGEGGLLHHSLLLTKLLLASSLAVLVYLCRAYPFKAEGTTNSRWRHGLTVALIWSLCGALAVSNVVWLFAVVPDFHPAKVNLCILLLLVVLLGAPFCERLAMTRQMPDSPWLFAGSLALSTFVLFLGNPIGTYVASSDFVGSVSGVAWTLALLFVIVSSGLTALYLLIGSAAQKILTLLSVFCAVCIMAYSAVGVRNAGVMSLFILPIPKALVRTNLEIGVEIAMLLAVLAATSYATVRYRHKVSVIVGAMLAASVGVTIVDLASSKGGQVEAGSELPAAHTDI